jgi:peptidoglycan/LPS O-acetylase OafA/YrhL
MALSPSAPLGRDNSFTFLRLFFALAVVFGHSYVLGGFGAEPLTLLTGGVISGREIAVQGFFVLSGFLIAKSLAENPSLWRFACHRAFRILPAYWVYLCGMVFVLAPLMLALRWPDRFGYAQLLTLGPLPAWNYFLKNWALQAQEFGIAPLFSDNPERFNVNGSLWSVHHEATLYLYAAAACGARLWPEGRRDSQPFWPRCSRSGAVHSSWRLPQWPVSGAVWFQLVAGPPSFSQASMFVVCWSRSVRGSLSFFRYPSSSGCCLSSIRSGGSVS